MTESCLTCGQVLPYDGARAWVDLDENAVVVDGQRVKLPPRPVELVAILLDVAPRIATRKHIMTQLYGLQPDAPFGEVVDVMVCRIRPLLAGTALRIETVLKRGYRAVLEDERQLSRSTSRQTFP